MSKMVSVECDDFMAELYQIVGTNRKPTSDTVLLFRSEQDAEIFRKLGFDTVAVVKGKLNTQFKTAVTWLRMNYKRCVLFGEAPSFRMIRESINPGTVDVDYVQLDEIDRELNNPEGYDEDELKRLVNEVLDSDEVKACSVLKSSEQVRDNILKVLRRGIEEIDTTDPRRIIQATMDIFRRMQFLDERHPATLTKKSMTGLLGKFVDLAYPTTVACREMLLYAMLPVIGSYLGAVYYVPYGSDRHYPSIFSLAIGRTTDGKGQAKHHVEHAMRLVDPAWFGENVFSNPASGEGLVRMLAGKGLVLGGKKSRIVIFNSEMVTTFNAAARRDSTLSGHLRGAYDGDRLENYRSDKKNSYAADNYILGFCGTITPNELRDVMPAMDWKNGAANRFLWSVGFKDKELGRSTKQPDFSPWAETVRKIGELNQAVDPTPVDYSKSGQERWDSWYYSLPEHNDDILSDSQGRAAANCARVANLYAQLDERRLDGWHVQLEDRHVEAAIEIVNRSRQTVEWYLAQSNVSRSDGAVDQEDLMKLKRAVAAAGRDEGGSPELTREEVRKLFSHKSAEERDELCIQAGLRLTKRAGATRPTMVWTWDKE